MRDELFEIGQFVLLENTPVNEEFNTLSLPDIVDWNLEFLDEVPEITFV